MEPQTNSGQYSIVTLTALGVVMLILSSAIGAILGPVFFPPVAGTQAQLPVQDSRSFGGVFGSPNEVRVLMGSVTAIKGNSFTLRMQTSQIPNDPLADRNVIVTNETKIVKILQKDKTLLRSEIEEFAKKTEEAKKTPQLVLPPELFTHVVASSSDVAIGDDVVVTSIENIDTKKEFIAREIQLNKTMKK